MREKIGFWEAFSIGVGGMIGGGIFAVLGLSIQFSKSLAPLAFLISGSIALLTSYSYAKLTMRFPSRGGTIEYIVRAFGTGVFSGALNLLLLASYVIMISLYAYAFGSYAANLFHANLPFLRSILISLPIVAFTLVNAYGAAVSGRTEDLLVSFKIVVLIFVAFAGITHLNPGRFSADVSLTDVIVGGMIIFLAYEGFELIANAGSDVENPEVLKKAFYSSVLFVVAIYVLIAVVAVGNLSYDEIITARDYALAEAAKPTLGEAGFLLVTIAAVVSTSSAINATLYGTAGVSYMVAKYGQLPERVEKPVWKKAYEGLVAISIFSLVLSNTASLEEISTAGSGGFLIIFLFVNLAALKLRNKLKIRPEVPLIGSIVTGAALLLLVWRLAEKDVRSLYVLISMIVGCVVVEAAYRGFTRREIKTYVDPSLEKREGYITSWESWVKRFVELLVRKIDDVEVYLVGSLAKKDYERAHDVDILVFTDKLDDKTRLEVVREEAGLKAHPIHVHVESKRNKEEALKRAKHYIKLEP